MSDQLGLVDSLLQIKKRLGCEMYACGGFVRDLVRGQEAADLDVVVRNVDGFTFLAALKKAGKVIEVGKTFGVYVFQPNGVEGSVEIAFPRTERSTGPAHHNFEITSDPSITLEEDAKRRDFTCNAMFLDVAFINSSREVAIAHILDFHQGMEHIKNRLIAAVGNPEDRITEDPLRMMRAAVLQAKTGFRLEGNTFAAMKRNADLIKFVSAERVRDEILKIMSTDKPSRAFKALKRCGVLKYVLPELNACVGVGQNPENHKYPVFEHCCYVADAACSLTTYLPVRFAGLFHDLGKAVTREVKPGGKGEEDVSFHNHEVVSERLVQKLMGRLRFSNDFTEEVIELVKNHQYKYDRNWTDRAVRRFIRSADIQEKDLEDLDVFPLFILRQADRIGNGTPAKVRMPITPKQKDFQARITEIFKASSAHSTKDLAVNGNVLMSELGLAPSPTIGRIMQALFELVEEDPSANNKETLLARARGLLAEEKGEHSE